MDKIIKCAIEGGFGGVLSTIIAEIGISLILYTLKS